MMPYTMLRHAWIAGLLAIASGCNNQADTVSAPLKTPPVAPEPLIHVYPNEDIQNALERASESNIKTVVVHEGTYRPTEPRQALIWLNQRHDGIHLKTDGDVILTAANPDVAKEAEKSYPAIVNHVIYCGDGLSSDTVIEGFKITGANNFTTTKGPDIELNKAPELDRTPYFYLDGGGVKIFGRSYPTLVGLEIYDNYSSPCGAGISVEHRGFNEQAVHIRNCIFRNNRVPLTGAALDLLGEDKGSSAVVENCLFVNNASNCSMDSRSLKLGSWKPKAGHGAITVFTTSRLTMRRCTMVGNRNGVDDLSPQSTYDACIFWQNTLAGGWVQETNYELDVVNGDGVKNCWIGTKGTPHRKPIADKNAISDTLDPRFDANFAPGNLKLEHVGYRPVSD